MRIRQSVPAELARDLAAIWVARKRVAHARPYDRWKGDEGETWWVVPSPERPAFRLGKIMVASRPDLADSRKLFVGLYVEKGIGPTLAAGGYYPDDWVIGPSWRWHGAVADLSTGALGVAILDAYRRTGEPIQVHIEAHVPVVRPIAKPPHDVVRYESTDGIRIRPTRNAELLTSERFLRQVAQVGTLAELGHALRDIPSGDSAWVNLYIGLSLECASVHDASACDSHQLADRLLEPFAEWVS